MKKSLDDKNIIGAVLMDLSKAFHCIPHDLLLPKLHDYHLSMDTIIFLYSYMKRRKQGVKINDTESLFIIFFIRSTSRIHPSSDLFQQNY